MLEFVLRYVKVKVSDFVGDSCKDSSMTDQVNISDIKLDRIAKHLASENILNLPASRLHCYSFDKA